MMNTDTVEGGNNPDIVLTEQENKEENRRKNTKIQALKKEEEEKIKQLSSMSNQAIEKALIYIGIQHYSSEFSNYLVEYGIEEKYFVTPLSQFILNAALEVFHKKEKVDFLLLKDALEVKTAEAKKKKIALGEFFKFQGFLPNKDFVLDYKAILLKNYVKNNIHNLSLNLNQALENDDMNLILEFKNQLGELDVEELKGDKANPNIGLMSNAYLADQLTEYLDGGYKTNKTKLLTGFKQLDNLGGFTRASTLIFGARPSVGKSVNMLAVMRNMMDQGQRCLYVSGEMYGRQIYERHLAATLNISATKISNPQKLSKSERKKIDDYNKEFRDNDLCHFYFDTVITARHIEQVVREINIKHGEVVCIFIDYLGKLTPNNMDTNRNMVSIMTDITKEVCQLGLKLNVGIVTAAQLSRGLVKGAEVESLVVPKPSDFRDSGSIEQDADLLVGIVRDVREAQICTTEEDKQELFLHVMKNRNGATGEVSLYYYPTTFRIEDRVNEFYREEEEGVKYSNKKTQEKIIDNIMEEEEKLFENMTSEIF